MTDLTIPIDTNEADKRLVLHQELITATVGEEQFEVHTSIGIGGTLVYMNVDDVEYSIDAKDFIRAVLKHTRNAK